MILRTPLALLLALSLCHAAHADVTDMLFMVGNSGSLTAGESLRKSGFESYGFTVTIIDDGASQSSIDAAAAANNFIYVSVNANAGTVGIKLKALTIGVVVEHPDLADEMGFCTSNISTHSRNYIRITNNSHYITDGFATGDLTILNNNQTLARRTGTIASGATTLAHVASTSSTTSPGLIAIEVGEALQGGGTAAGRRVLLPSGSNSFDISQLNAAGQTIYVRAMEWAARPNPALGKVLLVVTSPSAPTAQEVRRQMLLDIWGYDVTLIDDGSSQATFDAAFAQHDVAYICEDASASSVSTKLQRAPIGVVSELPGLSDELLLSTTSASPSVTAISISNNSHEITSSFSTGSLTIFTANQQAATLTGSFAPGLQTLATISSARSLAVVEYGAQLYGGTNAPGRRVQLPWGGGSFDINALNNNGKLLARRAIAWAAVPMGEPLLFVVTSTTSLSSQEQARQTLLRSWGYRVNLIDDDASQATFDAALTTNVVVYISERIVSDSLGTKLVNAPIGIVSEEAYASDEFGVASNRGSANLTTLNVVNGTHYITSTLGTGSKNIVSSAQPIIFFSGSFAPQMTVLAQWGSDRALIAVEAGSQLYNGTRAAGRRVLLPWGESGFDFAQLNANGQTILQRSLKWAAGLAGYWRLNETSGNLAADSSGNGRNGTVTGTPNWTTGRIDGALEINNNTYVQVAGLFNSPPNVTFAAWANLSSGYSNCELVSLGDYFALRVDAGGGTYAFFYNGSSWTSLSNGAYYAGTGWHHFAVVLNDDANTFQLYVDGSLSASMSTTQSIVYSGLGANTLIGRHGNGQTNFNFRGLVDDVRVYNYALGSSEIQALHGQTSGPRGIHILKWSEAK